MLTVDTVIGNSDGIEYFMIHRVSLCVPSVVYIERGRKRN